MTVLDKALSMPHFAAIAHCPGHTFIGLPAWYSYLPGTTADNGVCTPALTSLSDIWLVVAAVIEMLLRIAAVAAFGIIIYAGIEYTTSQGNPEQTSRALNTIISAAIGLVIVILSAVLVTYIAGIFK